MNCKDASTCEVVGYHRLHLATALDRSQYSGLRGTATALSRLPATTAVALAGLAPDVGFVTDHLD